MKKNTCLLLAITTVILYGMTTECLGRVLSDAEWWQKNDEAMKVNYVQGFKEGIWSISGFIYGLDCVVFYDDGNSENNPDFSNCKRDYKFAYDMYVKSELFNHLDNDKLIRGMDAYYKDYANQDVPTSNALYFVALTLRGFKNYSDCERDYYLFNNNNRDLNGKEKSIEFYNQLKNIEVKCDAMLNPYE